MNENQFDGIGRPFFPDFHAVFTGEVRKDVEETVIAGYTCKTTWALGFGHWGLHTA